MVQYVILLHDDQVFDLQPIKIGSLASESTFLSLARTFIIKKKNVGRSTRTLLSFVAT